MKFLTHAMTPGTVYPAGLFQTKALTVTSSAPLVLPGHGSRKEMVMASSCSGRKNIQGHPCFGGNHHKNGRMHLAVAPQCNIKCGYCSRRHDCANESRPGVTSRILNPREALLKVREVMASELLGPVIKVIGIAGPGD